MNDEIGIYLSSLERKLFWVDRKKRKDIIMEVRSHLAERVASGERPQNAIASFGLADEVARDYLRVYGFGNLPILLIAVVGAILAIFTVPSIYLQSVDALEINWASLGFLAAGILLILFSSFKGGRKTGIAVGATECVVRFVVLGVLAAQGSVILSDGAFGAIGFVLTSLLLPVIGYLSSIKPAEEEPGI